MKYKRAIAVMLATVCLTGCSKDTISQIPLVSALTQKELTDYYTEAVNYKSEVEHGAGLKHETYELNDVSDNVKGELIAAMGKVESDLATPVWNDNMFVTKNTHQYVKAILDDKILSRTNSVPEVKESQGHYFVTVEYDISPQLVGTIGNNVRYLGVHGAFDEDAYGNVMLNNTFIKWIETAILLYNSGDESVAVNILDKEVIENILKERTNSIEKNVNGDEGNSKSLSDINSQIRTPKIDTKFLNKVLGASVNQTAVMPELTSVYQPVTTNGKLSGYGIFPQGNYTLGNFGISRNDISGKIKLRYVFKRGLVDSNKLEFKNVYITDMQLDGIAEKLENENYNSVIPDFIKTEVEVSLDRADRCISNTDLAGLMSGTVYGDIGVAILSGFFSEYGYLQQNVTSLDKVIARDNESNNYLVQISTARKQGARGGEDYGCYEYSGYAVITQVGNDFVVTDYLYDKCEMTREPQINVDDTIMKRLASLVNAGAIDPDDKTDIQSLIDNLYNGCTERNLDIMRECYNTNIALLSSSRKEYLVSQLVNWLTGKGIDVETSYTGFVVDWIGGTNEQAEFLTQELIDYKGKNEGLYIKNYYIVSKYGDKWVIDDSKLVETKVVLGDELNAIRESIQNKQVFNVTNTVVSDDTNKIIKEIEEEEKEEQEIKDSIEQNTQDSTEE